MHDITALQSERDELEQKLDQINKELQSRKELLKNASVSEARERLRTEIEKFENDRETREARKRVLDQTIAELNYSNDVIAYRNTFGVGLASSWKLSDLYVEPELTTQTADIARGNLPEQPTPLDQILSESPPKDSLRFDDILTEVLDGSAPAGLFITGEPGIGKTTLLNMIAVRCAITMTRVPVFIELAPFALYLHQCGSRGSLGELVDYISSLLNEYFPNLSSRDVREGLRIGRYLLLMDALDEIKQPSLRSAVMRSITDLLNIASCRVVVTMRSATYYQLGRSAHYQRKEILPLRIEQIKEYIGNWFRGEPVGWGTRLIKELDANKRLRQLLSNPLLLYMMVIQLNNRPKDDNFAIPNQRVDLYRSFIDHLIQKRPTERFMINDKQFVIVEPRRQREYLRQIAFTLHDYKFWYAQEDLIRSIIASVAPEGLSDQDVEECLRYLEEETGLLQRRSIDDYAFSHFTFQEYFTAEYLNERKPKQDVLAELSNSAYGPQSMDPWWREVIVIYYVLSRDDQLLRKLLSADDNIFGTNLLLVVDCLMARSTRPGSLLVADVHQRLVDFYRNTQYILLQENLFNAILRLGEYSGSGISFLAEELRQTDRQRCKRAIEALGAIGTLEAGKLLIRRYQDEGYPLELAMSAIDALLVTVPDRAVEIIFDMLAGAQSVTRQIVSQMVKSNNTKYVQVLLSGMPSTSEWMQQIILEGLGHSAYADARAIFVARLRSAIVQNDISQIVELLDAIVFSVSDRDNLQEDRDLAQMVGPLLDSSNVAVLAAAIRFVGRKQDTSFSEKLFDLLLRNERNYTLSKDILRALGQIASSDAVTIIMMYIDSCDSISLRVEGIQTLGFCGDKEAFFYLTEQFNAAMTVPHTNFTLKSAIIQALAHISKRTDIIPSHSHCQLILRHLQIAGISIEEVAEATVFLIFQLADQYQVDALLTIARQHVSVGRALITYLFSQQFPNHLQELIVRVMDDFLRSDSDLSGPAFRLKMRLLDRISDPRELVLQALSIHVSSAICLEAIALVVSHSGFDGYPDRGYTSLQTGGTHAQEIFRHAHGC